MENEDEFLAVKLILSRYIQENRMRNTPERIAILELFYMQDKRFSAQEVYESMKDKFRVSRATVYNTILLFYTLGLLIRLEDGNQIKYQACFGERDYFRTVCTRCGRTAKFTAPSLSFTLNSLKYRRFHPEQTVTSVYGICSSCQSRATRARKKHEKEEELKEQLRRLKAEGL